MAFSSSLPVSRICDSSQWANDRQDACFVRPHPFISLLEDPLLLRYCAVSKRRLKPLALLACWKFNHSRIVSVQDQDFIGRTRHPFPSDADNDVFRDFGIEFEGVLVA